MTAIDVLAFMKVDCLGLGMMSCMKRSLDMLAEVKGIELDLATIPAENPRTYAMIRKADTVGVFQIESRAQQAILSKTLGVPLFQEQAMSVVIKAAGFSLGRADMVRRAMATFKHTGGVSKFHDEIVQGMLKNG